MIKNINKEKGLYDIVEKILSIILIILSFFILKKGIQNSNVMFFVISFVFLQIGVLYLCSFKLPQIIITESTLIIIILLYKKYYTNIYTTFTAEDMAQFIISILFVIIGICFLFIDFKKTKRKN